MTVFLDHAFSLQPGNFEEQIKRLQCAIDEEARRLEEVKQERARAEEDTTRCTKEIERRVVMVVETSGVADVLQELGRLLQEENHLSEQLTAQVPVVRNQRNSRMRNHSNDLHEMEECVTEKARSLTAQISEAKQSLAEARARCLAAQALVHTPTSKPEQKQGKRK